MTSGRVLSVAGSDPGGGAGIQADIKTITALGGFAAAAVTALTAQNTLGVFGVHDIPADFVRLQMELVLSDIGADCVKTGMLANAAVVEAVAEALPAGMTLVVDPVMVSSSGRPLLAEDAVAVLVRRLLPRAALVTPNLPEAEALLGRPVAGREAMADAARDLLALGCGAVLLKGGHLDEGEATDVLADSSGVSVFSSPRLETRSTHGTGCTLASAIATGLAQGMPLGQAVARARAYLHRAMETAPSLGQGRGPLNHGHTVRVP